MPERQKQVYNKSSKAFCRKLLFLERWRVRSFLKGIMVFILWFFESLKKVGKTIQPCGKNPSEIPGSQDRKTTSRFVSTGKAPNESPNSFQVWPWKSGLASTDIQLIKFFSCRMFPETIRIYKIMSSPNPLIFFNAYIHWFLGFWYDF